MMLAALSSLDAWPPTRIRRHQLRFLQAYVNSDNFTPSEINQSKTDSEDSEDDDDDGDDFRRIPPADLLHHPTSALGVLDNFTTSSMNFVPGSGLSTSLRHLYWGVDESKPWLRRVQRCIDSIEGDPNHIVLVEGIFLLGDDRRMFALTRMCYSPDAPEGEKYAVMNSMFRVIDM